MSTDEQATPASGSVPNAYGNALAWKWVPGMPAALKRAHLHTLLYALRSMANAAGELRFSSDRKPMRIKDIARAAGCDEKDCRDRLEAAIRAGVVRAGERRRGRAALYALALTPVPDWSAAVAYLEGVKATREEARQKRGAERKAAPWSEENGGRSPELEGPENGGPPPELRVVEPDSERGTAPRLSSGDRPPNGSGDRPPNTPGGYPRGSQDGADAVLQPRVDGPSGPQDQIPQEHQHRREAGPPPAATAGRCRHCQIPLIRPGRDLCAGCEQYLATTDHGRHSA